MKLDGRLPFSILSIWIHKRKIKTNGLNNTLAISVCAVFAELAQKIYAILTLEFRDSRL